MLIYSGKGFLVAVFIFGCSLVANLVTNYVTGGRGYWDTHKWPFAVSQLVSAEACWIAGRRLAERTARRLIDPDTGEEVVLRESHTFIFIPIAWWGPLLTLLAAVMIAIELAP